MKLKHCLKDISIKLIHFYKRCVSKTVVNPWHFLRAKEGSYKSPFLYNNAVYLQCAIHEKCALVFQMLWSNHLILSIRGVYQLGKVSKKKLVEFSTKKNNCLKHLKRHKKHFKTNLFFPPFLEGGRSFHQNWISQLRHSTILQLLADPYHTESVSGRVDHF